MPIDDILKRKIAEQEASQQGVNVRLNERKQAATVQLTAFDKWSSEVLIPILKKAESDFLANGFAARVTAERTSDQRIGMSYTSGYALQFAAMRGASLSPSIKFEWGPDNDAITVTSRQIRELPPTIAQYTLKTITPDFVQRELERLTLAAVRG